MLIAFLSDIHANREAFEACLDGVRQAGADRIVILGDIVGYGADPEWCVDKVAALAAAGAVVIRGNHDQAVLNSDSGMNSVARMAIDWTRNQLGEPARAVLSGLPLEITDQDRLYVHADGSAPTRWNYVLDGEAARRHFSGCSQRLSFCGHVHRPALYGLSPQNKLTSFTPTSQAPVPLSGQRRWLVVLGSVGQPRDGNPAAAYGLFDTDSGDFRFMRAAYDIDKAADKIRAAGLPESLAARLKEGR